jgi:hypothetical protein
MSIRCQTAVSDTESFDGLYDSDAVHITCRRHDSNAIYAAAADRRIALGIGQAVVRGVPPEEEAAPPDSKGVRGC